MTAVFGLLPTATASSASNPAHLLSWREPPNYLETAPGSDHPTLAFGRAPWLPLCHQKEGVLLKRALAQLTFVRCEPTLH